MQTKFKIGELTVDSGLLTVGDPCYQTDGRNTFEHWLKFCDELDNNPNFVNLGLHHVAHPSGTGGKAIVVRTALAEGTYSVYIEVDEENRPARLIIDLI